MNRLSGNIPESGYNRTVKIPESKSVGLFEHCKMSLLNLKDTPNCAHRFVKYRKYAYYVVKIPTSESIEQLKFRKVRPMNRKAIEE